MAIANKNDLTHIVRTTQQWTSSYDSYECIPEGVLCVEFTPDGHVKAKIGNGHDIFSKLPYIGGADLTNYFTKNETVKCVEDIIKAKHFIQIKGILQNKDQLPSHAECGDLYFVISQNQSSSNKYDEYVYSPSNTWETLGSIPIDIDLSEYAKIQYVDEKIEQINERIDDIEQHGTHTHANKDILDLITAAFTAEEKDKLSTLYNYDDTELRELITQASHTHSNKDILDAISAAFTTEDRTKLDSLTPYDDSILREKITALERLAHEHSNKRILDRTTASFTTEYERKMRWIRIYTGCTGMEEGIAGLVPAAQAGEEDYVLSGSGEWVPQTGGGGTYELPIASASTLGGVKVGDGLEIDENGVLSATGSSGDSIAEGDGITITTDPQTGVKTISVDAGNGLQINQDGELEIDPSIIPEAAEYSSGEAITIRDVSQILPAGYVEVDYIEGVGNYTVINYIPNRKTKIVGTALQTQTSYDPVLFGTRTGSAGQQFVFWFNRYDSTQAKVGFVYGTNTWSTSSDCDSGKLIPYILGDQFTFLISLDDEFNINDSFVHNITENGAPASNLKLGIFALVNSSSDEIESSDQIFRGRMYEFKIYEDDELVVNLIPAVSTSTNQGGFYDVINDIFYTSKTATPFGYDPSTIHSTGKVIDVNYGNGLVVNQDNELEVNIGDGLSVNANNEVELSKATANDLGGIKVGSGFVYTSDGLLNATPAAPPFDIGDGLELIYDDIDALPNGYGHVDYVCSNPENNSINANGRARTLIDYVPTNTTKLAIKMQRDSERSDLCFIGSRVGSRDHEFCFWNECDSVTELAFSYGNTNYSNAYVTYSSYITGQIIEVECVVGDTSNTLSVNGTAVKTYTKDGDASPYKIGIFQLYLNGSWGYQPANGKIYYIKLYEGNTLAVNLIPAVRLVDEVVGFYDNVNDKFYTSNTEYPFITDMSTLVIDGTPRTMNVIPATANTIGGIKVGDGLSIDADGTLSVVGGETYEAGNGIEITEETHEDEFRVQNQEYFFDTRGLTCGLNARVWTTVNDGDILAAMCIHNSGGNQVPLFVGLTEDSVKVSQNYDSNILGPNGSFDYRGKTWYFTADYALSGTDGQDTQNHIQTLPTTYSFNSTPSNFVPAAKDLIDLAVLLSDLEYPIISVKYKEGLKLNQYGELAVNVGNGLYIDHSQIDPTTFSVQNQEYFFDEVNVTATINGTYGPRSFVKLYADDCLFALCDTLSGGNHYNTPILVGLTADSVKIRVDGSYGTSSYGPNTTFNYRGKTWYCTSGYGLMNSDMTDQTGTLQSLPTVYEISTEAECAIVGKDLIDAAILLPDPDITTVNAKLGSGLSFDANGAIQATAQPLSPATDSTLGGVIVGEGINVDEYGEISLSAGEGLDIDFESPLPSEYTLVKGISSTANGNQYINTGYKIKPTTVIKMTCTIYKRNASQWSIPLGTRNSNNAAYGGLLFVTCWQGSSPYDIPSLWIEGDTSGTASSSDAGLFYNDIIELTFTNNSVTCYNTRTEDTIVLTASSASVSQPVSYDLFIFATNDVGTAHFFGVMDLYSLQIFEGSTKLYDYIPCQRNSDNKYGLYDIINDEFKLSPNNVAFSYVQGTPTALDLIQQIKLLPATENTIGGVKPGDGILVDNDGTISVDPDIIPEVIEYEGGTAISIEDVEHGDVIIDAWDSGTGWSNWVYTTSTGDSGQYWSPEVHSPIADSWKIPLGATQVRVKALSTSDVLLHPTMHWLTGQGTGRFGYSCPTGSMLYDSWIDVNSNATYMNLGIRRTEGSNVSLSPSEVKSVELTFQTASEIEVDVWNGGTGWLNGDYGSGTSNVFYTNWYYTYHYNYQQYIEVPEGATHVMVQGISNENDSHLEGGGCNAFDSNHNHVYWWGCAWEWHELSSDVKYVQPNVKWNDNNTRTISGSDIKSVTLVWKLPALEINQAINVKYGNGLIVNQNNELEVNLGTGLEFDQVTGAINVTGGGGSGDTVAEGNGISITTDQQTGEKVISVDIGSGLAFDPQTGAINVTGGGDTVAQGNGINITTDQQTGDKVIAVNPGSGLQVNQTTNELELKLGDGLELDEYNAITVDPFYPNALILNCVLDDEPSSDLILHFTLDPDE